MELHNIAQTNSIANHFLMEMRNVAIQKDRLRFRKNMKRLGSLIAYEFSKTLTYAGQSIRTPLAATTAQLYTNDLYLVTVLRAGLPFYEGILDIFDQVDSGFVGAYRQEGSQTGEIALNYLAADSLEGKELILADPMLATGNSLITACDALFKTYGKPAGVHIMSAVGTQVAVDNLSEKIGLPLSVWVGAIDDTLNDQAYIVPGLGDAGDLSYGSKL